MATFSNEMEINHNIKDVFNVFYTIAIRDFPDFKEESAVGTKVERQAGSYSLKTASVTVEITAYERESVYEVTTTSTDGQKYISKYSFDKIDEGSTLLTLEETQNSKGFFGKLNAFVTQFVFKNRVRKRLEFFVQGLDAEISKLKETA